MLWKLQFVVYILVLYTEVSSAVDTNIPYEDCRNYYKYWYYHTYYTLPTEIPYISQEDCHYYYKWWHWHYHYATSKPTTPPTRPPTNPPTRPPTHPPTRPPTNPPTRPPTTPPTRPPTRPPTTPPTRPPTTTPDPCACNTPPSGGYQFAFVGRVNIPNFTPGVPPPDSACATVYQTSTNCIGNEPAPNQYIRLNTPLRANGCPHAFAHLEAGHTYLFYGTFQNLPPDHRRSYVVAECAIPCKTTTCPAAYPPVPCLLN